MTADRDAEISARPVTPAAAAQALAEVAAVAERATWRPNPSAAGALALIYGALLAVNVWGNLGAMVPLLLLLGGAGRRFSCSGGRYSTRRSGPGSGRTRSGNLSPAGAST